MAIRFILAIPHFIALYFLGIAALVVVVIGWFGALVTGRLPRFAATYLSGYLRWYSRVGAYLLLLTDEYPPFAFGDAAYAVRLAVGSGKLNRLTVLFRIILAIPAAIVSILLTSGFTVILLFIAWLTALIAGRLPASLHQAFAAVLRYTIRYYGYLYLLTGAYPAGLFGDKPGAQTEAVPPPGGLGYGTAVPGQAATHPGYGAPIAGYGPPPADYRPSGYGASGYGALGYGTPRLPGHPAPEAGASVQAASWQLALSPGAKRLVGLMLVLGLLTAAAEGARAGATINAAVQRDREISQLNTEVAQFNAVAAQHNAAVAREQQAASQVGKDALILIGAHETLLGALNDPSADSSNCTTVNCFTVTALPVAQAFAAFGRTLRAVPVPPGSAEIAKRLIADTAGNEKDWMEITNADSFTSVENSATAAEKVGGRFDKDYSALKASLGKEGTTLKNEAVTLNKAATTLNHEAAALSRRATELNVTGSVRAANGAS